MHRQVQGWGSSLGLTLVEYYLRSNVDPHIFISASISNRWAFSGVASMRISKLKEALGTP